MLWRHLQLPAHMVLDQLTQKRGVRIGHNVIKTDAGADEYLFNPWQLAHTAQDAHKRFVAYA